MKNKDVTQNKPAKLPLNQLTKSHQLNEMVMKG